MGCLKIYDLVKKFEPLSNTCSALFVFKIILAKTFLSPTYFSLDRI